jgi:CRISPR-associated endonuclease/helicase Cas3
VFYCQGDHMLLKMQDFDRLKLKVDLDGTSLCDFAHKLDEIIANNPDKSILVIMNTIPSSVSVFNEIKVVEEEKFYLSTAVLPLERQKRIRDISERLKMRKRTILISTQVVGAGVHFDFDIVVRDLSPIGSIVQAAGRCNCNGERPTNNTPVYVFAVYDEEGKYFANKIYGNSLIEKTRETLLSLIGQRFIPHRFNCPST